MIKEQQAGLKMRKRIGRKLNVAELSLYLLTIVLLIVGCNKLELPEPIIHEPEFRALMDINGSAFEFDLRNAEVSTKFDFNDQSIRYVGSSIHNQIDSTSLRIKIFEQVFFNEDLFGDRSFEIPIGDIDYIPFENFTDSLFYIVNTLYDQSYFDKASWSTDSIDVSGGQLVLSDINPSQLQAVCLELLDSDLCDMTYCKKWVPIQGDHSLLGWDVNENMISPIFDTRRPGNINIRWDNESTIPERVIKESNNYTMTSVSKESENIVSMFVKLDEGGNIIDPCFAGFRSELIKLDRKPELGMVEVEFRDDDGIVYTSSAVDQESKNYFRVKSIEDTELVNQDGHPVKILDVEFSCILANNDGHKILLDNASARMAFRIN